MARFPGGIVRATPRIPTLAAASGLWSLQEALQARAQNIWPNMIPTTWNPSDKDATITLSNGNLTAACSSVGFGAVRSVRGVSDGKYYWEVTIQTANARELVGVIDGASVINTILGTSATSYGYFGFDGTKRNNASSTAYGATFGNGDIISVLLDMDAGTLTFWKNGSTQGTAFTGLTGTLYAAFSGGSASFTEQGTVNFGASAFTYSPPAGYLKLVSPAT